MQLLHFSKGPDRFIVSLCHKGAGHYTVAVGGLDFAARDFLLEKVGRRWSLWNGHQHEVLVGDTAMSLIDALLCSDLATLNVLKTQGAN
jgi:hypothetical protein